MKFELDYLKRLLNLKNLFWVYLLSTVIASILMYVHPMRMQDNHMYAYYNNYLIFKQTFIHLINYDDLYELNRYKHIDYWYWDYKYSPTFAVYMIFFAYLPDWLGMIIWNVLNSMVLFYSIKLLPQLTERTKAFILLFVLLENITANQNCQSNALIAGLIILAFIFMEKEKILLATLFIAIAFYIKPFAIVACSIGLFYPDKLKFGIYSGFWLLVLFALPLIFVSADQVKYLYVSWFKILAADHDASYGLSVLGWFSTWFNLHLAKNMVVLAGAILFCLPLLNFKAYKNYNFRLLTLASVLIWIVIFNHKAESPTFVIAATGIAIWYFIKERNKLDTGLMIFALLFTILSPTDLFPKYIRVNYIVPYVLKAVPCIFIWVNILIETFLYKSTEEIDSTKS